MLFFQVVVFFFLFLFYKYSTLRPNVDIRPRLKICSKNDNERDSCVDPDQVIGVISIMWQAFISKLALFRSTKPVRFLRSL
jgi:hypothetical protein